MKLVLERWNALEARDAEVVILPCCGSAAWARELAARRPFAEEDGLFAASDAVWWGLAETAWQEAFDSHPRIGQSHAETATMAQSLRWSTKEQEAASTPDGAAKQALAEANRRYEAKFGRIFLVCASGRTAAEILGMLELRMHHDPATELRTMAEQQRQITRLRLRRWLEGA